MLRKMTRNVLVTGGTGAIGEGLVRALVADGHTVTAQFCHNSDKANWLTQHYGVTCVRMDFTRSVEILGDFDVLINNAGVNLAVAPVHEITIEQWTKTFLINVTAPFLLAKQCLPFMVSRNWGRIINISSIYGMHAEEHYCPYNASKHALRGLTGSVARDYGKYGITCNDISPGPVISDMMRRNRTLYAERHGKTFDEFVADLTATIPTHQLTTIDQVAGVALFLLSEEAANINGVSIPVDGGQTC